MKITKQGGSYYTNYKKFTRLRPKHRPDGNTGADQALIWEEALMVWSELDSTWGQLA